MYQSRLSRYQEKLLAKKLLLALFGSVGLIVLLWFFGFRLLVGLSIVADFLKGPVKQGQGQSVIVQPPVLDELPEATNSAEITVSGRADAGQTLIVYLNDNEVRKLTVPEDGNFKIQNIQVKEGDNIITAESLDAQNNRSEKSNIIRVYIKRKNPVLDLGNPGSDTTIYGDNNIINISGKTEDGNTVTVNGRIAVVKPDGTFIYSYPLSEGDNRLEIIATDPAGNSTPIVRMIRYQK
jgi:hypothetical protein